MGSDTVRIEIQLNQNQLRPYASCNSVEKLLQFEHFERRKDIAFQWSTHRLWKEIEFKLEFDVASQFYSDQYLSLQSSTRVALLEVIDFWKFQARYQYEGLTAIEIFIK